MIIKLSIIVLSQCHALIMILASRKKKHYNHIFFALLLMLHTIDIPYLIFLG